jgi:H2-forming N5,N10-methylenetetrahydromethanopterin dehydrogenase-like enzyme
LYDAEDLEPILPAETTDTEAAKRAKLIILATNFNKKYKTMARRALSRFRSEDVQSSTAKTTEIPVYSEVDGRLQIAQNVGSNMA